MMYRQAAHMHRNRPVDALAQLHKTRMITATPIASSATMLDWP